jgi:hypothetical protein
MRKRVSIVFALILALAGACGAQSPTPAPAQGRGVYRFCVVRVSDAGDPLMDQYYGQPGHLYFSAIYSGDSDRSQDFLKWARSHYGRAWVITATRPNSGLTSVCNRYESLAEAQKALGAAASDGYQRNSNVFTTHTGWPDVPPDVKHKK